MNCILICRFSHVTRSDTNAPNYGSNLSNPQLVHKDVSGNSTCSALLEKDRQAMQVPEQAIGQPVLKFSLLFSLHRGTTTLQMVPLKCLPWWCGKDFYPASTAWIGAQVVPLNKSSKLTMGKFHFVTKPNAGRVLLRFECY